MVASVNISLVVSAQAGIANTITLTNQSGSAVTNYPFQFGRPFVQGAIPHAPAVLVNGSPSLSQADIKNRYPDGSVAFAVLSVVLPSLPAGEPVVLSFADTLTNSNTGLTSADMLDSSFDFDATITATPVSGTAGTVSARAMLTADHFSVWASGPVAQTIILADDSVARLYDIGFDGVHRPLRPRFYATFWPATNQVSLRVVGENASTTEAGDLAYSLSISTGSAAPAVVYAADLTNTQPTHPKMHWLGTNWSRSFWLGGTPSPEVNIDHNLAYLASTRWLPNFDATIKPTAALLTSTYATWTGKPHDLYDGDWSGGQWENGMGATGERPDIGPYPTWHVLWAYTGDWRMRQMALGMSELAAAWPFHFRETDPTRRLLRTDATGLNPSTGLGHTISITDRKTMQLGTGNTFTQGSAADRPILVGTQASSPWTLDGAHQPQPWFVPYVLTGDPWYRDEAYMWAGFSAARYSAGATYGRGPTGQYGPIADELRGTGWVLRSRAETAVMAPDADPEKVYFTYLTNDALARWEGGLGITGTVFDGSIVKNWGVTSGNYYSSRLDSKPPPLHNWEDQTGAAEQAEITSNINSGIFDPSVTGWTSPWMQYYNIYGLGRAAELGFAAGPLLAYTGQWLITMVTDPTSNPQFLAIYESPVSNAAGYLATWTEFATGLVPAWVSGIGFTPPAGQTTISLPAYYAQNLVADGRVGWAIASAGFLSNEPGGAAMWEWMLANVYNVIPDWASSTGGPKWAILPRTDTNVLPAKPTT